jgi:hypothetical protein
MFSFIVYINDEHIDLVRAENTHNYNLLHIANLGISTHRKLPKKNKTGRRRKVG